MTDLSEQEILDCNDLDNSCDGGKFLKEENDCIFIILFIFKDGRRTGMDYFKAKGF